MTLTWDLDSFGLEKSLGVFFFCSRGQPYMCVILHPREHSQFSSFMDAASVSLLVSVCSPRGERPCCFLCHLSAHSVRNPSHCPSWGWTRLCLPVLAPMLQVCLLWSLKYHTVRGSGLCWWWSQGLEWLPCLRLKYCPVSGQPPLLWFLCFTANWKGSPSPAAITRELS